MTWRSSTRRFVGPTPRRRNWCARRPHRRRNAWPSSPITSTSGSPCCITIDGEDEILYPLLETRSPEHAARTEEIDHQHVEVRGKIDKAQAACATWRSAPTPEIANASADTLDSLNVALVSRFDNDEREIVPLASVTITQKEWDQLGKHGVASIPASKRMIAFGMILEPLNDDDRSHMLAVLPPPVRLIHRVSGRKAWSKYATDLREGA